MPLLALLLLVVLPASAWWNPLIRDHSSDPLSFEKGLYQVCYNR